MCAPDFEGDNVSEFSYAGLTLIDLFSLLCNLSLC